jgi:fatty-acyl-CoA synthase
MEIHAATASAGLVMVPINFRLVGAEIRHTVEDSEAKPLIVQHDLVGAVEDIRDDLSIAESR